MSNHRAKTLDEQLTDAALDNASLCAKIHFLRKVIKDLGHHLGYNGDKETVIDAAKRVVRDNTVQREAVSALSTENQSLVNELEELKRENAAPL